MQLQSWSQLSKWKFPREDFSGKKTAKVSKTAWGSFEKTPKVRQPVPQMLPAERPELSFNTSQFGFMQTGDTKRDFAGRQNVGIHAKNSKITAWKDGVISFR